MSLATQVAELLKQARLAPTLDQQQELVRQAEMLKSQQHEAALGSGDWSAEDAKINDTLVPGRVHELHTAATDWIVDLDQPIDSKQATNAMVAEASMWFGRVSDEVKSYPEEYAEQAKNLARRLAGGYGDFAETAENTFVAEANRLRTTAVRAGLVVEAGDAGTSPEENKAPEQKHYEKTVENEIEKNKTGQGDVVKAASYEDTAADEQDEEDDENNPFKTTGMQRAASHQQQGDDLFYSVLAASSGNFGVYNDDPAQVASTRAPVFQELQSDSQDVVPVNDPGLGQTDDLTGANATRTGEEDHASKGSFPVSGNKKESSMDQQYAACPHCGGHGKVAVRATKTAVSGLPQIDQIVDPHDNGPAPTAYPAEVAFPWVLNPQAQVPAAIDQAEQQISQRNSLSPLLQQKSQQPTTAPRPQTRSSAVTAGGRDNSGWMGDNGARGVDYPGEQVGQYPAPSTADGYVDPAHGQGGDTVGNRPAKPYGAAEEADYTNNQGQNWQPGQDTHADQGWRETVNQNPALASAAAFLEQHRQAYLRNGR